jgi:hypothetical protein
MKPPPKELEGARLVCFAEVSDAVTPTGATTHRRAGEILGPAKALAICQYDGEASFYLFYCDEDWKVRTDTFHTTLDDAKSQAEFEYRGISRCWKEPG